MAAPRDKLKRWGLIVGLVLGVSTILTIWQGWCSQAGMATPLNAASKEDVAANTERIQKLEESQAEVLGWLKAIGGALRVQYDPQKGLHNPPRNDSLHPR